MSTSEPTLLDLLTPTRATGRPAPSSWLLEHLVTTGHLTETGVSRRARIRPCPRCHAPILAGLDADTCAMEAHVDPIPLTPLGEALARLEDRWTWTLHRENRHYVLDPRDHHAITSAPAHSRPRTDVLRQHHCGTPPPVGPAVAPTAFAEATPPLPANATPPF